MSSWTWKQNLVTGWKAQAGLDVLALPSPAQAKIPIIILAFLILVSVAIITAKRCRCIYAFCNFWRVYTELAVYLDAVAV